MVKEFGTSFSFLAAANSVKIPLEQLIQDLFLTTAGYHSAVLQRKNERKTELNKALT